VSEREYRIVLRGDDGETYTAPLGWLKEKLGFASKEETAAIIETLSLIREAVKPLIIEEVKRRILKLFQDGKHHRLSEVRLPTVFWMEKYEALTSLVEEGVLEEKRGGWIRMKEVDRAEREAEKGVEEAGRRVLTVHEGGSGQLRPPLRRG